MLPDRACADALFSAYVRGFPLRLRTIPDGDVIEEDHLRAESTIVHWLVEKGAVAAAHRSTKLAGDLGDSHGRDPRVFLRVLDHAKMCAAAGELLAELMRIKAEGDYPARPRARDEARDEGGGGVARRRRPPGAQARPSRARGALPVTLEPVRKDEEIVDVIARPARTEADVTALALRAGARP